MIVRELINKIGFKVDDAKLKGVDKDVKAFKKQLFLLSAAAIAAAGAMFALIKTTADFGDMLDKNAEALGFTVEQYQLLIGAAHLSGIEVNGLGIAMKKFNNAIGQAAIGNQMGLKVFNELGLGIRDSSNNLKSNIELLKEVADRMKDMHDPATRLAIAQQLFGKNSTKMVDLMMEGGKGIDDLMKKYGEYTFLLDKNATKSSARFNDQLFLMDSAIKGVKNAIGSALLPQINAVVKGWLEWFKANKKLALKNMVSVVHALLKITEALAITLWIIGKVIKDVTKLFGGLSNTIAILEALFLVMISTKILGGIATLVEALAAMSVGFDGIAISAGLADLAIAALPLLIAAAAAVLALLVDDITNFLEGNDSLIGRLVETLKKAMIELVVFINREIDKVFAHFDAKLQQLKQELRHPLRTLTSSKAAPNNITTRPFSVLPDFINKIITLPGSVAIPALAATNNAKTINANTTVNLTVPAGSTKEQQSFLKQAAGETFNEIFQTHLQSVVTAFPRTEF